MDRAGVRGYIELEATIRGCRGAGSPRCLIGLREAVPPGVLTEPEPIGHAKMDLAGLGTVRRRRGPFGSDHEEHGAVPIAVVAACEGAAVVVGDSPADIRCARAGIALRRRDERPLRGDD